MVDKVLVNEDELVLDEKWFSLFTEIASFEAYEFLSGKKVERDKQKSLFLNDEVRNPLLDYPELDGIDLEERKGKLLALKERILAEEENPVIRQIYVWKINEKLAELIMLLVTFRNLELWKNGKDEEIRWQKFTRANDFVNGRPDVALFQHTVVTMLDELEKGIYSDFCAIREAAEDLREEFPLLKDKVKLNEYRNAETELVLPDVTLVESLVDGIRDELVGLLGEEYLEELGKEGLGDVWGADEMQEVFQIALEKLGVNGDWKVEVVKNKSAVSVNHEQKKVLVPEDRKTSLLKVLGLVLHEIGTHIARRVNGENSKVKLLGLGLDRYISGEEGVATTKQQIHENNISDFSGLDAHLAISLAKGVDGIPRDFRDVFEILRKYYYLRNLLGRVNNPMETANNRAWNYCVRVFRGTLCDVPGVCFTKDKAYREGNAGIWSYLEEHGKDVFREFSLGKYNPANPRHRWILHQLGLQILDSEELLAIESLLRTEQNYSLQRNYLDVIAEVNKVD